MPSTPWIRRRRLQVTAIVAALFVAAAALAFLTPRPAPPAFKLYVGEDALVRVGFDDLAERARLRETPSEGLRVTVAGEEVPLWVEDGGDGRFGPGDHIELTGRHPRGEGTWFDEHTDFEVYRLELDAPPGSARLLPGETVAESAAESEAPQARLFATRHLERDIVRARFRRARGETAPPTPWYWARLSQLDEPFVQDLDLSSYDALSGKPVKLRLRFRGWSQPRRGTTAHDHEVHIHFNDRRIAKATWNGQDEHLVDLQIPARWIEASRSHELKLKIPRRRDLVGNRLVDVVLLDWIEVRGVHRGVVDERPANLRVAAVRSKAGHSKTGRSKAGRSKAVRLASSDGRPTVAHSDARRWLLAPGELALLPGADRRREVHLGAVTADALAAPAAIEVDRPSDWRAPTRQADYLMIVHPHLREELEPLADFHRERGLTVEMVEVDDIYDEFRHGRSHPQAIRDFIVHAADHWAEPKPRFVLLAGDASWDTSEQADDKNYADWTYRPGELRRFLKNGSTPYDSASPVGHRNLIPTWDYRGAQGHAASDVFFVVRDPEARPLEPMMAIGRIPVVTPEELRGVVSKTIRYARAAEPGPWRERTLWITNDMSAFQARSDRLSAPLEELGFAAEKVYPARDETDNAANQAALHRAFNEGQLLVNFYGHGGRYIWRTGPPDLKKNHDLFTLDDLDLLEPNERLPLVVSLSCYSAPFDHPTADSIGEKFLRLADRGAVAVIAASWRNSPNMGFATDLFEHLTNPGTTIGEALNEAKSATRAEVMVAMYNLLGDPALELALPPLDGLDSDGIDIGDPDTPAAERVASATAVSSPSSTPRSSP